MNKYSRIFMAVLVVSAMFLAACGNNKGSEAGAKKSETIEIKDELGTQKVKKNPKNIVVLEYSFADAVKNHGNTPVGIADDNKKEIIKKLYGEDVKYTSVGTRKQPNLESISSLKPDLIIADVQRHKGISEDLKKIAPTLVLKSREASYDDVNGSFKTIGKALGKEDKAKQLLEDQDAKIKKAKDKVTTKENKGEKVLIAVAREDAFQAHTSTSYAGQLLTKLGLDNAVESKNAYEDVNLENLSKINPDKIIFTTDKKNPITDDWKEKAIWKDLKVYKKGQIYQVDRDFWTRFRGINANEYIIKDLQKYNEKK